MSRLDLAKNEILLFAKDHPGTTFVELEHHLARKNLSSLSNYEIPIAFFKFNNLLVWTTRNSLLAHAIVSLTVEKKISFKTCNPILYALDGECLRLPITNKQCEYKTPHWIPVSIWAK